MNLGLTDRENCGYHVANRNNLKTETTLARPMQNIKKTQWLSIWKGSEVKRSPGVERRLRLHSPDIEGTATRRKKGHKEKPEASVLCKAPLSETLIWE